jgi:hypothetical protein
VTYDLGRVLPRWDEGNSWSQALLFPPLCHPDHDYEDIGGGSYFSPGAFELLDLLNQILGDELRREGREMVVEGEALSVLAPPAVQQQVRVLLEGLEQSMAGEAALRVDFLPLAENASEPATLLSEEEAQKLVGATSGGRSYSVQLAAGRTAVLDARRTVPFLFDFNVEIAQGVCAFDPILAEASTGMRLALRASAAPGGTVLALLFQDSALRSQREFELALAGLVTQTDKPPTWIDGPKFLQIPEVDLVACASTTFLPDGKALAYTFESDLGGKKARQVVVLRKLASTLGSYVARKIPGSNRSLIVLDAGLFRGPSFEAEFELIDGFGLRSPQVTASLSFESSTFLVDWLRPRFSIWRPLGPWVLIVTDPAWDRDAGAQLERLVKGLTPRTALTEASLTLSAGGARLVRARMPLLEGSQAGLVVGHGRTAVVDYDIEVAQNASVHDPEVAALFEGLACKLTGWAGGAALQGLAQLTSPGGLVEAGGEGLGAFERPEFRSLRFNERARVGDGRPLRVGPQAEKGEAGGLALELTLTPLGR